MPTISIISKSGVISGGPAATLPPAQPTSVTASDHVSERIVTLAREVKTPIYVNVTLPAGHGAEWLHVWIYDGTIKEDVGTFAITDVIKFWRYPQKADLTGLTVLVSTGKTGAENTPSSAVSSASFTIAKISTPAANNGITATVGAFSYTHTVDGILGGLIQPLTYTDPTGANLDFWVLETWQDINADGSVFMGEPEKPHGGEMITGPGNTHVIPAGVVGIYTQGGLRHKLYVANSVSSEASQFTDTTMFTLQAVPWNGGAVADHYDQMFGAVPAGQVSLARADPATLSSTFTVKNGKFDIATGGVSAGQIGSVNATTINGSILANQIGSVNATSITGSITAGQIESVNATTISGALTADHIGTVNATSITGTLTATQIGTVNATSITGTLTATQIGTITAGQIATITAGQITGQLTAGQITTIAVEQITGVLSAAQIGTINATAITGVFTPTQIGSIAATTITGTLTAAQIGTITAGQITGLVISSQLAEGVIDKASLLASAFFTNGVVNDGTHITFTPASMTTGTWSAAQIGSVNSGALVGSISSTLITSVNAAAIVGYINAANINSINASAITGSINAANITSINGTAIAINAIDNTKISGIAAGKLTAGTIVAGMTITAPTINGGSITGVSVTGTSTVSGAAISGGSLSITTSNGTVAISTGASGIVAASGTSFGTLAPGACTVTVAGVSSSLYTNSLVINGVSCIDSSVTWTRGVLCTGFNVHCGTLTVDGSGTMQSLSVNGSTSINSSNVFVGAGINCPNNGIACSGINPVAFGVQYYGKTAPSIPFISSFGWNASTLHYKGWDGLNYSLDVVTGIGWSEDVLHIRGGVITTI